jgi:hypothetical protein
MLAPSVSQALFGAASHASIVCCICSRQFLALRRSADTSAIWSLSGAERTWWGHRESDANDPMYGPAVRRKRVSSSWWSAVLHQCIRPSIRVVRLRAIMDISARAISLADRPQRAIRVTSVRMRREDRTSISSHPLADLGGQSVSIGLCHRSLPFPCVVGVE